MIILLNHAESYLGKATRFILIIWTLYGYYNDELIDILIGHLYIEKLRSNEKL